MELYIRIKNGQPFEHPIFGDNFRQAFPDVDINNLPPTFARFTRVPKPVLGVYEVCEGCTYEWDNGVVTDVHHVRAMTEEEKAAKISAAYENLPEGWSLDEETLQVSLPPKPEGDGWTFDLEQNAWVEVAPNE